MTKEKFLKEYRVLCLVIVVIVCIILTGAGREHIDFSEMLDQSMDNTKSLAIINDKQFNLEKLISERWILRVNYSLNSENTDDISILQGYKGDNQLLGSKLEEAIALVITDEKAKEWFPTLYFDAYEWYDEDKGAGIISLVLTKESKLAFQQLQDTALYEQLPDYAMNNLKDCDSSSVQKIQLFTDYNLQEPIEGNESVINLNEAIRITRNIDVIMPETL